MTPLSTNAGKHTTSSNIILGSTEKLSSNHIYFQIMSIPAADEKLSVLYTIKVRQYAISRKLIHIFKN